MPTKKVEAQPAVVELPTSTKPLHWHVPHPHQPQNANVIHAEERRAKRERGGLRGTASTFNQWLAEKLTDGVSTMWCAYAFTGLAILGFPGFHASAQAYVSWVSQTCVQLVMLSILSNQQKLQGRKQEIQSDEAFNATMKTLHDAEQTAEHLNKQDAELLKQTALIIAILKANGVTVVEGAQPNEQQAPNAE